MRIFKDGVGRKFFTCFLLLSGHYVAMFAGKIPTASYEYLTLIVLGILVGGNIGERMIDAKKPAGPPDVQPG